MGNYTSTDQRQVSNGLHPKGTIVDGGYLYPQGIYNKSTMNVEEGEERPETPDHLKYNLAIIQNLILSRKLAPFYKGYSDISDIGTSNNIDKVEVAVPEKKFKRISLIRSLSNASFRKQKQETTTPTLTTTSSSSSLITLQIYQDPVECPICFLNYPKNINYTRCCNQPICTECFIQIKRGPDFSPACCPFCMESNFGVIYSVHLTNAENATSLLMLNESSSTASLPRSFVGTSPLTDQTTDVERLESRMYRSKSELNIPIKHLSKPVVLSDDIRPELLTFIAKQEEIAAEAARRAEIESFIQLGRLLRQTQRRRNPFTLIDLIAEPSSIRGNDTFQELEVLMLNEAIRQSMLEAQQAENTTTSDVEMSDFLQSSPQ